MSDTNKIILIVLDSLGVGELPDAEKYKDKGANTLKHIFESMDEDFTLENLAMLGLYNIVESPYGYKPEKVTGCYGKMATMSPAKDTTAGHWELAGIVLDKPFPTYPNGFPKELIEEFEKRIGTKVLGNCVASGTEIIKKLGDEHCKTGYPIVYTSADSVFQIACHENNTFFGFDKLKRICNIARDLLQGEHAVGRVIARPFNTIHDEYVRTPKRFDLSLNPPEVTVLDKIKNTGGNVIAVGKISDIFAKKGITLEKHTNGNVEGIKNTIEYIITPKKIKNLPHAISEEIPETDPFRKNLIFTNLVDFDMLWGHRRDVNLYAQGLKFFDRQLPSIIEAMADDDILIITADHGCDPTYTKHTDHTREYVPLLVYGKNIKQNVNLGTRESLSDVGQTIADIFNLSKMKNGKSFKDEIEL